MKMRVLPCLLGFLLLLIASCSDSPVQDKAPENHAENLSDKAIDTISFDKQDKPFPEKIQLFSLLIHEDESEENKTLTCFISLSDILYSREDSKNEVFFPLMNSEADTLERIPIEDNYRRLLLKKAGISEKHSVYLYNYETNKQVIIPVSRLKSLALLNIYSNRDDAPYEDYLYHVGLQFDSSILDKLKSNYGDKVVIYIGSDNPFVRGGMQPVKWAKRKESEWPGKQSASYLKTFKSFKKNNPLSFKMDSLTYWVRDWGANEFYRDKRELVVVNTSGQIIYTELLEMSEGCSLTVLNGKYPDFYQKEQFVGHLIKDVGPTFIGFESYSFGCDLFRFLQFPQNRITLNCDNRH